MAHATLKELETLLFVIAVARLCAKKFEDQLLCYGIAQGAIPVIFLIGYVPTKLAQLAGWSISEILSASKLQIIE
ncbi:hypothetical protein Nepgr_009529 [Nepenthes gracilis]|uniref:Uncharacterized protein n=1 Tax=Nepenthes gracilis TaxID=150966 RepID=A0AAD3SBJ4_NEPGR|nr:hypothetical protein Nepgr_009529 [Nepenthes gracilis]